MCSTSLDEYIKIHLLPHLQATTCRTRARNLLRTTLCNARWSSNMSIVRNVQRLSNSSAGYRGGQSSRPIRTSNNSHTHTGNTRQSEPCLKDSSCSSVILSHNSRDVILSHNSRNATCFSPIPRHNSRNTPTS